MQLAFTKQNVTFAMFASFQKKEQVSFLTSAFLTNQQLQAIFFPWQHAKQEPRAPFSLLICFWCLMQWHSLYPYIQAALAEGLSACPQRMVPYIPCPRKMPTTTEYVPKTPAGLEPPRVCIHLLLLSASVRPGHCITSSRTHWGTGPWAAWSSEWLPCPQQEIGTEWAFNSNTTHSMILWTATTSSWRQLYTCWWWIKASRIVRPGWTVRVVCSNTENINSATNNHNRRISLKTVISYWTIAKVH